MSLVALTGACSPGKQDSDTDVDGSSSGESSGGSSSSGGNSGSGDTAPTGGDEFPMCEAPLAGDDVDFTFEHDTLTAEGGQVRLVL